MKLYNTVVVWDCYTVAENAEAARTAAYQMIQTGELPPSESVAPEVKREGEVRDAWRNQNPIVAADVSEADFAKVKGKTTLDVYNMLHTKPVAAKPANGKAAAK
jgi:hypothetical protein